MFSAKGQVTLLFVLQFNSGNRLFFHTLQNQNSRLIACTINPSEQKIAMEL
jgi:DNA-binding NtrC family response regulator